MLALVNGARQAAGEAPLVEHPALVRAAQKYAETMASTGCYEHDCPPVPVMRARISNEGYTPESSVAENIFRGPSTVQAAFDGWMGSAGHQRNILHPLMRATGLGVAASPDGQLYWVQTFGSQQ
jgi:uncharacterized protein YkwD